MLSYVLLILVKNSDFLKILIEDENEKGRDGLGWGKPRWIFFISFRTFYGQTVGNLGTLIFFGSFFTKIVIIER